MKLSELENVVFKVLSTIKKYESGFVSAARTPVDPRERCYSVRDYVECRLNYELFKLDETVELEQLMDGYLLVATDITDENERHYDKITFEIGKKPDYLSDILYNDVVDRTISIIGGNKLIFGSDKRDPSVTIYLNDEIVNISDEDDLTDLLELANQSLEDDEVV